MNLQVTVSIPLPADAPDYRQPEVVQNITDPILVNRIVKLIAEHELAAAQVNLVEEKLAELRDAFGENKPATTADEEPAPTYEAPSA